MRESCKYGSVRGANSNGGPYRNRREFITFLGGAAAAWPLAARGQQTGKLPTIGFLGGGAPTSQRTWVEAFLRRLHELGWTEGRTIAIEYRWANGRSDSLPEIAAEFVRLKVALIYAVGTESALAAKQATSVIPIVFPVTGDPVGTGLVASLARPGGNVTGLSNFAVDLAAKRLEILHWLSMPTGHYLTSSRLRRCASGFIRAKATNSRRFGG